MHANDSCGRFFDCFAEYFSRMHQGAAICACGDFNPANESVTTIQTKHPKFLDAQTEAFGPTIFGNSRGFIQFGIFVLIALHDTSGDFHHRHEL